MDLAFKVVEVAERLEVTTQSLQAWPPKVGSVNRVELDQSVEVRHLKAELRRVTDERDVPKKAAAVLAKGEG